MSEQSKMDAERAAFEAAFEDVFFSACFEREDDDSYAGRGLQGAWLGWQKARSLPVGVPDGYALVPVEPTLEMLRSCRGYGISDPRVMEMAWKRMLESAPAAPTVKAEPECLCTMRQRLAGDGCSVCNPEYAADHEGEPAPSLTAAGSADLTAVRCQCCATEYPHDSYDAGFIAGSGMCQVCDAAMPPKDLPAAGSAGEDVEVVAHFQVPTGGSYAGERFTRLGPVPETPAANRTYEPLMTVAQHERIVAALRAQIAERDAAIEEWSGTAVQNGMEVDRLNAALSAQQSKSSTVTRDQIRDVFMRNGFTVKEGKTDLKPYVYAAAEELLALVDTRQSAQVSVPVLSPKEREDLMEFHEAVCCDAGHRVEKGGMQRLAEIGAVQSVGFGRHRLTEFGVALLNGGEA